ncbi:MAG: divalent-cation tolerance protein CutA [bacterium]
MENLLLQKGLMNYVNLPQGKMKSVFYWQVNLDHSKEHSMLAQTTRDQSSAIQRLLSENHSYDFPCLLALPILWGNREFLNWIKEETYPQESIG